MAYSGCFASASITMKPTSSAVNSIFTVISYFSFQRTPATHSSYRKCVHQRIYHSICYP
jgi:hypothetical protein